VRTRVVFTGEYDIAVKEQLRDEFERLVEEPILALDFTDVSYIDSTCVTELLRLRELRKRLALPTPTIVMKAGNPIRRIFDILDLRSAFDLVEELDATETSVKHAFAGATDELPTGNPG